MAQLFVSVSRHEILAWISRRLLPIDYFEGYELVDLEIS